MDQCFTIMTLILMGDWCSGELTPKLNETAAIVKMRIMTRLYEKRTVSHHKIAFSLDRCPLNG
jgi:hypothetical protein